MSRRSRLDWTSVRDDYVIGEKSLAEIAKAFGVSVRAVEKHAANRDANGGRTWSEWRAEFRTSVSAETAGVVQRIKVVAAARIAMQHATILAALAAQAAKGVRGALAACEPKDKIKLALAIIAMERRVHGLDRVPLRVELTGKDGGPVEHEIEQDIDEGMRAIAERMLETVFSGHL